MDATSRIAYRLQLDLTETKARNLARYLAELRDMRAGDPADDAELAELAAWVNHRVIRKFGPDRLIPAGRRDG
jgi:hypothetical protein